ncbi:MAG: matrixin family metalloprotease [Polyangia bacterium]
MALEAWNQAAGTQLIAGPPPAGMSAVPIHFQGAAAPDHGLYDAQSAQIFLNDDLTGPSLAVVTAHEIGHAMGLVHIDPARRVSVMNPGNLSTTPTSADAAQLTALWGSCH